MPPGASSVTLSHQCNSKAKCYWPGSRWQSFTLDGAFDYYGA